MNCENNKKIRINFDELMEEASYERESFIYTIKRKLNLVARSKKEPIYTIRPLYLYLIKRLKYIYKHPKTYTFPPFEKTTYNKCIEYISHIKKEIKELENIDENRKLWKYYKLSLTTLRKYAKLHTYKDVVTTLSLQKKLNGNSDVCRHILSYM